MYRECDMCSEVFADKEIEEMLEMGEKIYCDATEFICPDCYDDYHRLALEEQLIEAMKHSK